MLALAARWMNFEEESRKGRETERPQTNAVLCCSPEKVVIPWD
jgi:hypothetical protein